MNMFAFIFLIVFSIAVVAYFQSRSPSPETVTNDLALNGTQISSASPSLLVAEGMSDLPQENLLLIIQDQENKVLVTIDYDGHITYGEGYTPDVAARILWDAVGELPAENARLRKELEVCSGTKTIPRSP